MIWDIKRVLRIKENTELTKMKGRIRIVCYDFIVEFNLAFNKGLIRDFILIFNTFLGVFAWINSEE